MASIIRNSARLLLLLLAVLCMSLLLTSISTDAIKLPDYSYAVLPTIAVVSLVVSYYAPRRLHFPIPFTDEIFIIYDSQPTDIDESEKEGRNIQNFSDFIAVVHTVSPRLASSLGQILDIHPDRPFETTAAILSIGIESRQTNPVEETVNILESHLNAREFVKKSDSKDLRVVQVNGGSIACKLSDDQIEPNPGLGFKLYVDSSIPVEGRAEVYSDKVADLRVEEVKNNLCFMKVVSWESDVTSEQKKREKHIMSNNPRAQIDVEGAEEVDWDMLEQTYEYLSDVQSEEGISHEN